METSFQFWKMHGAANDFILFDDRALTFPSQDCTWIERIATRHTGIGAEGVILIQPASQADFRMRFFNPDGGEVDMCGNGARCVARLAHHLGVAPAAMRFETRAGIVQAWMQADQVKIQISPPKDWRLNSALTLDGRAYTYHFVNTGVPHVVVPVDDLDQVDVARLGAAIRYHPDFAPKGTNANFIGVSAGNTVRVRTYERGVESETPACGTGMIASALVAGRLGLAQSPVTLRPTGGDVLQVAFTLTADGAEGVTLTGPAEFVFEGMVRYQQPG